VALYGLLLLGVASLPGADLQRIQTAPENPWLRAVLSDPFMHALTFGLFSLLLAWGLAPRGPLAWIRAALLALGFGLLIELYQALLPWRAFGIDDLVWNAVGVLLCLAALGILGLVQSRRLDQSRPIKGGET
jgi:VanZ family protein